MKPYQDQNHYELLEVAPSASAEEIREALARAQAMFAEDSLAVYTLVDPAEADALRGRIQRAGQTLLDDESRETYDRSLGLPARPRPSAPLASVRVLPAKDEGAGLTPTSDSTHPEIAVAYHPPVQEVLAFPTASLSAPAREDAPPRGESASESPREAPSVPAVALVPEVVTVPASPVREAAPAASAPGPAAPGEPLAEPAPAASPRAAPVGAPEPMPMTVATKVGSVRPKGMEIPPDAEFNGELLRQVRESRGQTVAQIADRTRIGKMHLENVEADRYDALPAAVYLRGILMNLARELQLDPLRVAKSYLTLVQNRQKPS